LAVLQRYFLYLLTPSPRGSTAFSCFNYALSAFSSQKLSVFWGLSVLPSPCFWLLLLGLLCFPFQSPIVDSHRSHWVFHLVWDLVASYKHVSFLLCCVCLESPILVRKKSFSLRWFSPLFDVQSNTGSKTGGNYGIILCSIGWSSLELWSR